MHTAVGDVHDKSAASEESREGGKEEAEGEGCCDEAQETAVLSSYSYFMYIYVYTSWNRSENIF